MGGWEARGISNVEDRLTSLYLREHRAVRLSLTQSCAAFVSDPYTNCILLQQENMAVVYAINAMVSSLPAMIAELRKLQAALSALNVHLDAKWLPSAVNRFADAPSQTWDPGDVRVSQHLLSTIAEQYRFDAPAFSAQPLGEPRIAQFKVLRAEMHKW